MYGTLRGALAGRKIAFDRDTYAATVDGRISGIGKTIRIKSIHVHYDIAVPAEAAEATERARNEGEALLDAGPPAVLVLVQPRRETGIGRRSFPQRMVHTRGTALDAGHEAGRRLGATRPVADREGGEFGTVGQRDRPIVAVPDRPGHGRGHAGGRHGQSGAVGRRQQPGPARHRDLAAVSLDAIPAAAGMAFRSS